MTDLQLKVLRILWDRGERSASDVQAALRPAHDLAATTVSTLLARMAKRGDISMRRSGRQFFYSARIAESDISARKLTEVADLLFAGSAAAAISHLLDSTSLDAEELKGLQKQIAEKEAAAKGRVRK
ncbi:MAG: BlaI/MecI/CopY family transcriptional regulator [Gemmatimonadales bacterium]